MKYSPALRDAGIVVVQLLLFAMSWPCAHWPFGRLPESRPECSILNCTTHGHKRMPVRLRMTRTQFSEDGVAEVHAPLQFAI